MPPGKFHAQDSVLIAAGSVAFTAYQGGNLAHAVSFALGSLSGVILSPDLDQDGLTISEMSIIRRIPVLGWAFYLYWFPYAKLIKHRHWTSHAPVIGTIGRLLYLAPLFFLLAHFGIDLWNEFSRDWIVGLAASDAMHWFRDFF